MPLEARLTTAAPSINGGAVAQPIHSQSTKKTAGSQKFSVGFSIGGAIAWLIQAIFDYFKSSEPAKADLTKKKVAVVPQISKNEYADRLLARYGQKLIRDARKDQCQKQERRSYEDDLMNRYADKLRNPPVTAGG